MCDVCNVILSAALSVKMLHNSDGQALGPANYKKKTFYIGYCTKSNSYKGNWFTDKHSAGQQIILNVTN